jgi:hypothetical protein
MDKFAYWSHVEELLHEALGRNPKERTQFVSGIKLSHYSKQT